MKKIELAERFLKNNINLFKCKVCGENFIEQRGHSIFCPNHHSLDISKKGSIHFINHKVNTEYNGDMLESRRRIIDAGLFDGILEKVSQLIPNGHQNIIDVGSGDGSPLVRLENLRDNKDSAVGFDISKPGVNLSTSQLRENIFFCVADLSNLPFSDHSISVIMDLFSPSSYNEFNRVICSGGHLIKIIPNAGYLIELRKKLYEDNNINYNYDNNKVLTLFKQHYPQSKDYNVKYTFEVPSELRKDLLIMTPLHWGKDAKNLTNSEINNLDYITVDVTILDNKF
jgi:23S rRNA (guanine745-N1)-methyltransferase